MGLAERMGPEQQREMRQAIDLNELRLLSKKIGEIADAYEDAMAKFAEESETMSKDEEETQRKELKRLMNEKIDLETQSIIVQARLRS